MSKFILSQDTTNNKNGKNIVTRTIKAKNEGDLISYNEVIKFVDGLQKADVDVSKLQIVGNNRLQYFTLKGSNEELDRNYMKNKPDYVADIMDGFYQITFIEMTK